jgi:hypothetical protein
MSDIFQNIDPPPPHRPASVYPPPPFVRGEDTLAGWRGVGGQYFGRRQTLRVLYLCKYFVIPPISNFLCLLHALQRKGASIKTN